MKKRFFNTVNKSLGMYLVNCGYEDCCENFTCAPHYRGYYLIHYVIKGSGYFEVDGQKHFVEAGSIFIIHPKKLVTYYSPDPKNTWSFCWVGFSGNNAQFFLSEIGLDTDKYVYSLAKNNIASVVLECLSYIESVNSQVTQLTLNNYLLEVLNIIGNTILSVTKKNESDYLVEQAIQYIEYNYMNDISTTIIANFFSLDRTYFFRIFKRYTNISPSKYIISYRIKKATEFLKSNDYTISQIAAFVGINDIYYFSKLFKKEMGITPSQYRKTIKNTRKNKY